MIPCQTYQLLVPIGSSPTAFNSRTGAADSMEAVDSSALVEGKDIAFLVEGGMGSTWVFQRQPAVPGQDVQFLDDPSARWRIVSGDHP